MQGGKVMGQGRKFSIREVSEICNIPSKTLRYYDEIALVVPEFRDESSRYRYYGKDQIITLCIIRKLRKMGFGLKAIQCIISGNTATDLERNIETKLDEIAEEINSLERTYYSMKAFMERLKNGVDLLNIKESLEVEDVSIETIRPTNLVYTRKTMANYANAEVSLDRWVELSNLCDELDLKSDGSYIVTYHSNPLEQFLYTDTDIEFGISVEDVGSAKDFRTFGNFTAATAIHLGNYADIMQTHVRLVQWINKNQYKIVGPVSEEFIISPLDINNINEHVTKIIIPVEKIQKNKEV
jgi:DNA-binding transcriptional MerR regulator